jgi:tyrosinase
VADGGFDEFHLSYPSPHTLRRNFTLLPFDLPVPYFSDPLKEGNASFSASAIEAVLNTSAGDRGDYKGFQTAFETFEVRT